MRKLEITDPVEIRIALRHEGEHSSQSRFVHRLHCVLLVGMGQSCYEIAKVFGDNPRTVERWARKFQQHGVDGLKEKSHPGRNSILSDTQKRQLALALTSIPRELGYEASVWSNKLLRVEILRQFHVMVGARYCQRLFRILQLSRASKID